MSRHSSHIRARSPSSPRLGHTGAIVMSCIEQVSKQEEECPCSSVAWLPPTLQQQQVPLFAESARLLPACSCTTTPWGKSRHVRTTTLPRSPDRSIKRGADEIHSFPSTNQTLQSTLSISWPDLADMTVGRFWCRTHVVRCLTQVLQSAGDQLARVTCTLQNYICEHFSFYTDPRFLHIWDWKFLIETPAIGFI